MGLSDLLREYEKKPETELKGEGEQADQPRRHPAKRRERGEYGGKPLRLKRILHISRHKIC